MRLKDRIVVVTGAGSGIGRACAIEFAAAGAKVVVADINPESAVETVKQISALNGTSYAVQTDVSKPGSVQKLVDFTIKTLKRIDALINNAAIFEQLDWQDTSLEAWQRHLQINLTAPFQLSQAFARWLDADASGCIVNLLDWRALRPGADHLPYTISKAGLAALTRSLAQAFAPRIRVNALALGAILPPSDGADTQGLLENIPARRWAHLEEVSQAVLFLLDGAEYITGEIIHLDGGRHLV